MPFMPRPALGLAVPLCLLSQAALADLTPTEVWGDWRNYMEGMGYSITASESSDGADLEVSDLSMSFTPADQSGTVTISLGTLTFAQNNDGSVAVILPQSLPITISGVNGADPSESFTMAMTYAQTGHSIRVSGTPEEMTYAYGADTFALTLDELMAEGRAYGPEEARFSVSGSAIDSTTTMSLGAARGYDQAGRIGDLAYDIFIKDPEEGGQVTFTGGVAGIEIGGGGTIPLEIQDQADMAAMLRAGFDVAGRMSYESGSSQMQVSDPVDGDFSAETSSAGGGLGVEIGADRLLYEGAQQELAMSVNAADVPFPIQFSLGEAAFRLAGPTLSGSEPQDFGLALTLGDFKMSDMIWGIFDPTGQLPREAATLALDMTGKVQLDIDYLDPAAAARMEPGGPGEVQEVEINTLILDAAGARLEGSGAVTLDNEDLTTVPGMPKPVGQINLALQGGGALIDKLVAMGLLPSEQAMGARMMMGLFAVPTGEPDSLTSQIEFTEDGQILANGQRIK
jgi:hypothetical protein